jgi:hypothetical protein
VLGRPTDFLATAVGVRGSVDIHEVSRLQDKALQQVHDHLHRQFLSNLMLCRSGSTGRVAARSSAAHRPRAAVALARGRAGVVLRPAPRRLGGANSAVRRNVGAPPGAARVALSPNHTSSRPCRSGRARAVAAPLCAAQWRDRAPREMWCQRQCVRRLAIPPLREPPLRRAQGAVRFGRDDVLEMGAPIRRTAPTALLRAPASSSPTCCRARGS